MHQKKYKEPATIPSGDNGSKKTIPSGTHFLNFQLNSAPADIPDMYSKPGTACNEYTGYCDVFQKCREVNRRFLNELV